VSIAAPVLFWHLKGFSIEAVGVILDYITYMTYDLHGQWDYGNKWSNPGCPAGNCLRSHISFTETVDALSMITKAGVPSAIVVVGVISYGHAFKMNNPGCVNEMCTYAGPASQAPPGNVQERLAMLRNKRFMTLSTPGLMFSRTTTPVFQNILVYNIDQRVVYVDSNNKAQRTSLYKQYNLGSTTD
jgi:chitinase